MPAKKPPLNLKARSFAREREVVDRKINRKRLFFRKGGEILEKLYKLSPSQQLALQEFLSKKGVESTEEAIQDFMMDSMYFDYKYAYDKDGKSPGRPISRADEAQNLKKVKKFMNAINEAEKAGLI